MRARRGAVLILALWVLGFLAVLAVSVAAGIRQKMILFKRLDERQRSSYVMQAALKKTCVIITNHLDKAEGQMTPLFKRNLFNKDPQLSRVVFGRDEAGVIFDDEESKINLNTTNKLILKNLIIRVLSIRPEAALRLAESMLDWRQYGDTQLKGFFSDDYYAQLQFPYVKKDAPYQSLDELLLVKGIDQESYLALRPFITIYGEGRVNINTASGEVLSALGFDDDLVSKIVAFRRGKDGQEGTIDDHIFTKTFDVAVELASQVKLLPQQLRTIDAINAQGFLTTNSYTIGLVAQAGLKGQVLPKRVQVIYDLRQARILYWKEK